MREQPSTTCQDQTKLSYFRKCQDKQIAISENVKMKQKVAISENVKIKQKFAFFWYVLFCSLCFVAGVGQVYFILSLFNSVPGNNYCFTIQSENWWKSVITAIYNFSATWTNPILHLGYVVLHRQHLFCFPYRLFQYFLAILN